MSSSSNPPNTNTQNLFPKTPLAEVHGARYTVDGVQKSLFTPVDPVFPTFSQDGKWKQILNQDIEGWQRDNLMEFTSRELLDLDALFVTTRSLKPGNLDRRMMFPCLEHYHWETDIQPGTPRWWMMTENLPGPLLATNQIVCPAYRFH